MKVFSLFFKIIRYNKASILSYMLIFLLIFLLMSSSFQTEEGSKRVRPAQVTLQVEDHDQTALSQHFQAYLLKDALAPAVPVAEEEEAIKEALYTGMLDYFLVIPAGFTASLQEEGPYLNLLSYPSSYETIATSMDMKIISYVKNWELIARTFGGNPQGEDMTQALALLDRVLGVEAEIYTYAGRQSTSVDQASVSSDRQLENFSYYMSYLDYIITAVAFLIVGRAMVAIENPLRQRRDMVSGLAEGKRTFQLFAASYLTVTAIWLLMVVICFFLVSWSILSFTAVPLMLLSSLIHLLAMVSLTLLLCSLAPTDSAVSFLSNLMSLFLAFSAGIFIPAELLWEPFHKMSSIFPTYWDIPNQQQLMSTILAEQSLTPYYQSLLIMVGLGLVYFCLTLIQRHYKAGNVPA